MNVEFLKQFNKDIGAIKDQCIKDKIAGIIDAMEKARSVIEIPNIKKLRGYKYAYRIRVGDYRIGLFCEKKTVEFARIIHRKEIYKYFP